MLLILEVILTAWVCVKLDRAKMKWAKGLIPFGCCLVVAFILGLIIGGLGITSSTALFFLTITPDVLMVIALIIMEKSIKPVP